MSYHLHFELPGLPALQSKGRMHWRVAAKEEAHWKGITRTMARPFPPKPLRRAKALFVRHSAMEPDDDNLRASFKSIRDGLVARRPHNGHIIEDDRPAVLEAEYRWEQCERRYGYVSIDVWEVGS